jgi:hypothetical protein
MKARLRTHAVAANTRHSTLCLRLAPRPERESITFILFRYFCVGALGAHAALRGFVLNWADGNLDKNTRST